MLQTKKFRILVSSGLSHKCRPLFHLLSYWEFDLPCLIGSACIMKSLLFTSKSSVNTYCE